MRPLKTALFLSSLAFLAACGGSNGTSLISLPNFAGVGGGTPTLATVSSLGQAVTALNTALSSGAVQLARPSTSSAVYNGVITTNFDSGTSTISNLTMTADFAGNSVNGTAAETLIIVAPSLGGGTVAASGSMTVTGTILGTAMAGTMNGPVTTGLGTYTVSSNLNGLFANSSGQNLVLGTLTGSVVLPDTSSSTINSGSFLGIE